MAPPKLIKCVQKLLSKIRSNEKPDTHQRRKEAKSPTILDTLPPELIIYIAQIMPISSTALFALSCKTTNTILGQDALTKLRNIDQYQQHFEFLTQLSKEYPAEYVPCYHCRVLHQCTVRQADRWSTTRAMHQYDRTRCYTADLQGNVPTYIHRDFQFRTFQMAMKRYCLDLDYKIWLDCLCREQDKTVVMQRFESVVEASAKIVNGCLLYRTLHIIFVPLGQSVTDVNRYVYSICPHVEVPAHQIHALMPQAVACGLDHRHDLQQCLRMSDVACCTECPTDYQFELEECENFGAAVIVTKWLDLGEGRTIHDPKWFSRLSPAYTASTVFATAIGDLERYKDDEGSFRASRTSIRNLYRLEAARATGCHP